MDSLTTENVSTLKIHKLSQEQYDSALASGNIGDKEIYLVPDEEVDTSNFVTVEQLNGKVNNDDFATYKSEVQASLDSKQEQLDTKATSENLVNHINDNGVDGVHFGDGEKAEFLAKIDTAKDEAVAAAATDAKTKADNALSLANAYTDGKISDLVDSAPETMNTLNELATAIKDHNDVTSVLNEAIGTKANKADFESHTENKSNPHEVTKDQVGLGNVPNVTTNDQTPTYNTVTSLTTLTSGEKLSTAFGKIRLAITSLINHMSNTTNPHSVTKSQLGLGNVDNTSDENKPISSATQAALDDKSNSEHVHIVATANANGFLSADDKAKLDGIETGATRITVDSALSPTSTNPLQNKAIHEVISMRAAATHSHGDATTSASGFMGASDKSKLDAIPTDPQDRASSVGKQYKKLYLIGALNQGTSMKTYSNGGVYVDTDGCLYSDSKKVITDVETAANWDTSTSPSSDNPISAERATALALALEESLSSAIESGELTKLKVGANLNTAEGSATVGSYNIVNSKYSMAVGINNKTNGQYAMTVGGSNTISASYAFAAGDSNTVDGRYGVALGLSNTAHQNQTVIGLYADTASDGKGLVTTGGLDGSVFVVGNGTSTSDTSNVFRASMAGQCYGLKAFLSSGADFAEYFEWADGNPNGEDRRGRFVTLDGEKIRYANADDDYILGVVSTIGAFIGNTYSESWQGRYLTDVFGEWLTEQVDVPEETETYEVEKKDEETGETVTETVERVIPAHTETRYILNPDYDPEQEYISREFRKEWSPVGFHGQVVVIDDGTCQVNGYCKPSTDGIATASESGYRVMSRIDDAHIKVLVR